MTCLLEPVASSSLTVLSWHPPLEFHESSSQQKSVLLGCRWRLHCTYNDDDGVILLTYQRVKKSTNISFLLTIFMHLCCENIMRINKMITKRKIDLAIYYCDIFSNSLLVNKFFKEVQRSSWRICLWMLEFKGLSNKGFIKQTFWSANMQFLQGSLTVIRFRTRDSALFPQHTTVTLHWHSCLLFFN